MKSRILIASLLGSVGIVVAAGYGQVEVDTWCITYESTYLVPVFNQGSLSSTKDSGRLPIPISPSLRPTFANNTSNPTRSALSTNLVDSDTSLIDSQSVAAAVSTSLDVAPTEAQFGPTTENLTDEGITSLIALDSTATTDAIPTTSLAAAERSVIFQIVVPDNNKRDINRRSTRAGFVGNDNPKTCTFASTFVLSQVQVVDNDAGQLVFRNTALPNGEAGFCQTSDGRVYMTFSGEPAGCVQVTLAVYDVAQCQNGQLLGDTFTSTAPIGESSETTVSQENNSEVTAITGHAKASSSGALLESISSEDSTNAVKSTASLSSAITTATLPEFHLTQSSILSEDKSTDEPPSSRQTVFTDSEDSTSSGNISTGSTTTVSEEETTSNASERTPETTNDIQTSSMESTATTDMETTATEATVNSDTVTISDTITTTKAGSTATEITTALATTTSSAAKPCSDLKSPYIAISGDPFTIACGKCYFAISAIIAPFTAESFTSCIDVCSLESECEAVDYLRTQKVCYLFAFDDRTTLVDQPSYDLAYKPGTEPVPT
ncbi:hypothetical protein FAUST_6919 [Fusarium austroamericanum]|uniref:Apple domain-containing protein n=1 Tax=Fusarium austroamericanum TaxID=282268 RepID=A0AAN5Z7P6_FUSAU|nr:hypothetical protein FAUST_6919 [Fusarium austroamericanum]